MTGQFSLQSRGDCEIVISRLFRAPRTLVFDAWTQPSLVRRWLLGPPGWSMSVCEIDLRVGGAFRYVWRHTDFREMGLRGLFEEIVLHDRIVHTEMFDADWTGGETRVTTTFTETERTTTVQMIVLYASKDARDGAARSGMEGGIAASYDRLDAIIEDGS